MSTINYNGCLISDKEALFGIQNRGLRYGDGLFESIRMFDSKIPFFEFHWNRLRLGAEVLEFNFLKEHTLDFFYRQIQNTVDANRGNISNARIRLSIYRKEGGFYSSQNNDIDFIIEIIELQYSKYNWDKEGLRIGIYNKPLLFYSLLSSLKTCNSLPYIVAGNHAKKMVWDAALLLNNNGRIAEAHHSNVFLVKEGAISTPPLSEACMDGVLRRVLVANFDIVEKNIDLDALLQAEEIFLTNSIQGIRWVKYFEEKEYTCLLSKVINGKINLYLNKCP